MQNILRCTSDIRSRVSRLWLRVFGAWASAWIAQTGYACTELSSLQLLETAQHTYIVWVLWVQPHHCRNFLKGYRCFQNASYATAEFVQVLHVTNHSMLGLTSISWSNHMWLTQQWSRINDCHFWLAFIFCITIGGSWLVMSSLDLFITTMLQEINHRDCCLSPHTCCTNTLAFVCQSPL